MIKNKQRENSLKILLKVYKNNIMNIVIIKQNYINQYFKWNIKNKFKEINKK